jgi:predicted MFS family arabinose efflux permease
MKIKEFLPEEWGLLYAAFAFSQGIGLLSYWALPLVAGSLITGLGLSTTEVGMIGTIEGSGLFISSLLLANFVDRGYRKRVAIMSVAVVVIANLACGIVNMGFIALAIMRFVTGIGAGLALAVGNATIANARDAEKFSGHLTVMLVAFMVVIMPALSRISDTFGYQGIFLGLAVTVLISAISIIFLPDGPDQSLAHEGEADSRTATGLLSALAIAVLMIALLFGARGTLPWLVAEQLGTDAGMSLPQVGNLFSLMYAVSILGPGALLFLARVAGVRAILFWSLAVAGFFNWLFTVSAGNTVQFSVGIIAWATIYFIAFAQINAVAALADRKGRLVSAVGSAFIAGVTIAPFIGGSLVDAGGYTWLGAAEIILTILIAIVVLAGIPRHIKDPD